VKRDGGGNKKGGGDDDKKGGGESIDDSEDKKGEGKKSNFIFLHMSLIMLIPLISSMMKNQMISL
jgi:hypothetical protein